MTLSRRTLLRTAAATVAGVATSPILAAPSVRTDSKTTPVIGEGDHRFEVDHDFLQLPSDYHWQITHNVAVDGEGLIYVIHEGEAGLPDHPAIFVFTADGRFVRAFGRQFQGGGHGLEVRREGDEEFLYVTAYKHLKFVAKLTRNGEEIWRKQAPMQSGRYAEGEATSPDGTWGRDRFLPTNFAFLSDGRQVLADGYGAWTLHVYNADGSYSHSIGRPGSEPGEFKTPHGLWVDDRGEEELICVADRANNRLQWLHPDGTHVQTKDGYLLPANIDQQGDLLLVPELLSRITLVGPDREPVARLNDDEAWREQAGADNKAMRRTPSTWKAGRFVHPHDACFDADGNILVAEWVSTGRVSKLTRL